MLYVVDNLSSMCDNSTHVPMTTVAAHMNMYENCGVCVGLINNSRLVTVIVFILVCQVEMILVATVHVYLYYQELFMSDRQL